MKTDIYLKGVLTVIAASLLFIAVELGTTTATAQMGQAQGPTRVIISGVQLLNQYGDVIGTRLPIDTGLPMDGGALPVSLKYVYQVPLPVAIENASPVRVTVEQKKSAPAQKP